MANQKVTVIVDGRVLSRRVFSSVADVDRHFGAIVCFFDLNYFLDDMPAYGIVVEPTRALPDFKKEN